jgi:hypothetical protein
MNLAVAKSSGVVGSPRFKCNWDVKDRVTVEALYRQVVEVLNSETSLGLYNGYKLIFGEVVARRVAINSGFAFLGE